MDTKRYLKILEIDNGIIMFVHGGAGRYGKYIDLWHRLRMFIFFAWTSQPKSQRNLPRLIREARKACTLALTFDRNFGQSASTPAKREATASNGPAGTK